MDTLLIRLLTPPPQQIAGPRAEWVLLDAQKLPLREASRGELSEVAELATHRRVVVLVPAEDVLFRTVRLKARNRQQVIKAVPYALEEDLADDVEDVHFALGRRINEDEYPVVAIGRSRMDGWLEELRDIGITAHVLMPDLFALPLAGRSWSVLIEPQRALVRTGAYQGFSTEPENLNTLLGLALMEADTLPDSLDVYQCLPSDQRVALKAAGAAIHERQDCPPALMVSQLDERSAINLLQGPYQLKGSVSGSLRPWRAAAILAGIWLSLQFTSVIADLWRLSHEDQALKAQIEQVFKETFPDITRIVNPRVQMEQQLRALDGEGQAGKDKELFVLLDAGGRAITQAGGVSIDNINYRAGRLELSLSGNDLQALETIKERLNKEGVKAQIESADTSGQRVEARLLIQRGGAG